MNTGLKTRMALGTPARSHRARRFLMTVFLMALLGLLALPAAALFGAAPNAKIVQVLNPGDKLTVKGQGCQPQIQSQKVAKIRIKCATNNAQPKELQAPAVPSTIKLAPGDILLVKRSGCNLEVKTANTKKIVIRCIAQVVTPTPTRTGTVVITNTPTRTGTLVITNTPTRTSTPTRTRTVTPTATATVAGTTSRVSVASDGTESDNPVGGYDISANGRYVAFDSYASTLVEDDENWNCETQYGEQCGDIFVHDRQTGETTLVSVSSEGEQGDTPSQNPAISADGRYVAFDSYASNWITDNKNCWGGGTYACAPQVYVHDRQTGETKSVSVKSDGTQVPATTDHPTISDDGRYVAFFSYAAIEGPTNNDTSGWVFVHDRQTGITKQVSVNSNGEATTGQFPVTNAAPAISPNGRYVGFYSNANNLHTGDTVFPCNDTHTQIVEQCYGVYIHDLQTGKTERISRSTDGTNGGNSPMQSSKIALSYDGRYVMYELYSSNLVAGDNNDDCYQAPYDYNCQDIFLYDRQTGQTTRVSIDTNSSQFDDMSFAGSISGDGRHVTFTAGGGFNWKAYIYDRETGKTSIYSRATNGNPANNNAYAGELSADGRSALFTSLADNLVIGDTNECSNPIGHMGPCLDLFVRER